MRKLVMSQFAGYLQPRPKNFYKGDAGHLLIVGGNVGYSGATLLAAKAALRVGVGLVSIATRIEHAYVLNVACPEIMCHGVTTTNDLSPLMTRADVIVVGPGLGQNDWSHLVFETVLQTDKPLVVDADALNLLAKMPEKKNNWILTPHPGEAGRLLNQSASEIQRDRSGAIKQLQKKYNGICVLKGSGSLVLGTDEVLAQCEAGNPGMATAGMGDVLSGVIGGLLGQGLPLDVSAKLGVLVHALAGDQAATKGERGMIATDLLGHLRELVN